ncbi:MAG: hypothetical protein A4E66_00028 [Syntrophus sp. PtaB.Bin001]|nr:MAG: hypothetical protein A4E66_00028 [Syntrophus sp. PtaB.Bin001]
MSVQNEMRRVKKTNLEHSARRLRMEIESLAQTISINLDCGLKNPEELPVNEVDSQWDELKSKWADLNVTLAEIKRLEAELT